MVLFLLLTGQLISPLAIDSCSGSSVSWNGKISWLDIYLSLQTGRNGSVASRTTKIDIIKVLAEKVIG